MNATETTCACGRITGEPCCYTGDDTVMVEWMPPALRESHAAAGNRGIWPHNGAERLPLSRECADRLAEADPEWTEISDG